MTSPSKPRTYTVNLELESTSLGVTILADSLEDAVTKARCVKWEDVLRDDVELLDGSFEPTGVWA